MIGSTLGRYRVISLLGSGGMGEVYRATDTSLGRDVALKVLPHGLGQDPERLVRFQREAKALATLDHPGIVTVYSVEQAEVPAAGGAGTVHFLTMQLVDGQSLDRALPGEGLSFERVIEIAIPLTEALAAAHEKGIVHRDLKLANVMITAAGHVKVLDFGLAKEMRATDPAEQTKTSGGTAFGVVMGTPAYMSPEQIEGKQVHASSDIFSLGIMLYELATGRRPFTGDSGAALMSSILRDTPPAPSRVKPGSAPLLDAVIASCLDKNSARRPDARALGESLRSLQRRPQTTRPLAFSNPRVIVPAALVLIALAGWLAWSSISRSRRDVFVAESLPRIESLARNGKYLESFELARDVIRESSPATISGELWDVLSVGVSIGSTPAGATVTIRPFGAAGDPIILGVTPLSDVRVPRGALHWRAELAGYQTADLVTGPPAAPVNFELRPDHAPDRDMIHVPRGDMRLFALGAVKVNPQVTLGAFLIDRQEVTNRQFAAFVAAGGYTREEFWKHPFVDGARTLTFREAMDRFRDMTGQPGPATWKVGAYPDGDDDLPVGGLSWYEAAAYTSFAGKELPTLYHWYRADTANDIQMLPGLVLPTTNNEGSGPRAATTGSMSAYGAINMAGNVREWVTNASSHATRLTVGGAWTDPAYLYLFPEARSPFDRSPGNGVRGIKRLDVETAASAGDMLPAMPMIDRSKVRPVSDAEYAVFTRFYERRSVPLDARIESTDESSKVWIKHRVSFAAGYGNERLTALLYLPRTARPPYQVMIQMAGAATFYRKSSATERDIFGWNYCEYLLRGGRAVFVPLWKGSYERSDGFHPLQTPWPSYREHVIQWVSELRQSIDYLQSRNDVARDSIAYQGISNGAIWAPLFMALEPRLKAGIVLLGGLLVLPIHDTPMPPEIDGFNYAPRVTAPVLMLNGRNDALFPYETSQLPLYQLLGTPTGDKRHLTFASGHSSFGWTNELIKEGLDWLDRWFGPPAR